MQLRWLQEFLRLRSFPNDQREETLRALLHGGLQLQDAALALEWKKHRARMLVDHIKQWARQNSIPLEAVVTPASAREDRKQPSIQVHKPSDGDAIRRAIIAAVADMTLQELEAIAIPLRHVLRHFTAK
jgi:hypothetical protein